MLKNCQQTEPSFCKIKSSICKLGPSEHTEDIWFGKWKKKVAKLLIMTFDHISTCYLCYKYNFNLCHKDTETKLRGTNCWRTFRTAGLTGSWMIYKYGLENGRKSGQIYDDICSHFFRTAGLTCSWMIYKYVLENGRKSGQINGNIWSHFYLIFILQVEF